MSLPSRWIPLRDYFSVLLEPLIEAGVGDWLALQASGPDGENWSSHRREFVDLAGPDPVLLAVRRVASLCGATATEPDPEPSSQQRRGVYYAPASLFDRWKNDHQAAALSAIVLDIDDREHGGRDWTLECLSLLPRPTALVTSGGGVQAAYVLREALVFDRDDPASLEATVSSYLRVALALQYVSGADATAWPSHLFRCPGTYHLKDPDRPILVSVEVEPARRFNLSDFDEFTAATEPDALAEHTERLVARLTGRSRSPDSLGSIKPLRELVPADVGRHRVLLPRRVSRATVHLLNTGRHPRYQRGDGSLDRSRAVYGAALSLLAAGLEEERIASLLAASALRPAIGDRGEDGPRWVRHQISTAKEYLSKAGKRSDR